MPRLVQDADDGLGEVSAGRGHDPFADAKVVSTRRVSAGRARSLFARILAPVSGIAALLALEVPEFMSLPRRDDQRPPGANEVERPSRVASLKRAACVALQPLR